MSVESDAPGVTGGYAKLRDEAQLKGYTLNSMQRWTRNQKTCHISVDWSARP